MPFGTECNTRTSTYLRENLTCLFLFSMNRLDALPRGFGSFPVLEVLDFTYNNISEGESLPGNFFMLGMEFQLFKCNK